MLRIIERWEDIAPGTARPPLFSPETLVEHERLYQMWLRHQCHLETLDKEFGLGEFGYVAGDETHFQLIRKAVECRREQYVSDSKNEEEKNVKYLLWPYRDDPSGLAAGRLTVIGKDDSLEGS